jgi:hypothetical protein
LNVRRKRFQGGKAAMLIDQELDWLLKNKIAGRKRKALLQSKSITGVFDCVFSRQRP